MTIGFYLMGEKGLRTLQRVVRELPHAHIAYVVGARDSNVTNDYFQDILELSNDNRLPFFERCQPVTIACTYAFAVSWRWLIKDVKNLIVLHDSLLPKYRGFAPLPTALINGDQIVGVTALWACGDFDRGDIIDQRPITIAYPIKIKAVIETIGDVCSQMVVDLCKPLIAGMQLPAHQQEEQEATYSLWRDEEDYRVNWNEDATYIKRFIDSLGDPYKGAVSFLEGRRVRIYDAAAEPDIKIEYRQPGKVIFVDSGSPIVVCGHGLLRISELRDDESRANLLPLRKFRSRFT
jgi:methionyl-tRNA formyltransferase